MRHLTTLFFSLLLLGTQSFAQSWKWGRTHKRISSGESTSADCVADKLGNIYQAGYFHGTIIFGNDTLINNNGIFAKAYLTKYDSAGNCQWAKQTINGISVLNDIAVDAYNNIYAIGIYDTIVAIDDQTLNNPYAIYDWQDYQYYFVAKFDHTGNVSWIRDVGEVKVSALATYNAKISIDGDNKLLIGFTFSDTAVVGNNTMYNSHDVNNQHTGDVLIAKYDTALNPLWSTSFGGNHDDRLFSIAATQGGDFYISGLIHSDSITFGNYTLVNNDTLIFSQWADFLVKFNSIGIPQWLVNTGGDAAAVATDSYDNVFIAGGHSAHAVNFGSVVFPATPSTVSHGFIAKYNPLGTFEWAKQLKGQYVGAYDACVDACNNVWIEGCAGSGNNLSPDTIDGNILQKPIPCYAPNFIAGWDNSGNYITASIVAGGNHHWPNGISADPVGKIYMTAEMQTIDTMFIADDTLINGVRQMFIAKFDPELTCFPANARNTSTSNNMSIYPNPTNEKLYISSTRKIKTLQIGDAVGRSVMAAYINHTKAELNIGHFVPGLYFIKFVDEHGHTTTEKIIKE